MMGSIEVEVHHSESLEMEMEIGWEGGDCVYLCTRVASLSPCQCSCRTLAWCHHRCGSTQPASTDITMVSQVEPQIRYRTQGGSRGPVT